jgi:hypothetical protein
VRLRGHSGFVTVSFVEWAAVSWSLFLVPAHRLAHEHGPLAEFAAQLANLTAEPMRLPTVEQVLAAGTVAVELVGPEPSAQQTLCRI